MSLPKEPLHRYLRHSLRMYKSKMVDISEHIALTKETDDHLGSNDIYNSPGEEFYFDNKLLSSRIPKTEECIYLGKLGFQNNNQYYLGLAPRIRIPRWQEPAILRQNVPQKGAPLVEIVLLVSTLLPNCWHFFLFLSFRLFFLL